MVTPDQFQVSRHDWQFFVSLTFKQKVVPPERVRLIMLFAWLRQAAKIGRVHFSALKWVVRQEAGELGGRIHLHALLDGLPGHYVNDRTCKALESLWEKVGGGFPVIRKFNPALSGVGYVLDGIQLDTGANQYELSKFGGLSMVIYGKTFLAELKRRRRGQNLRHCAEGSNRSPGRPG